MDGKRSSAWRKSRSPATIDHDFNNDAQNLGCSTRRWNTSIMIYLGCIVLSFVQHVHGFTQPLHAYTHDSPLIAFRRPQGLLLHAIKDGNEEEPEENEETNDDKTNTNANTDEDIIESNQEEPSVLHDVNWRVDQIRLEEANTRRFLKSGPRFLPFGECRKWVIAFNRWDTEEEWRQWIEDGEKRNAYIPSSPDVYYGKRGEWKGWDHFLGVERKDDDDDENSSFQ